MKVICTGSQTCLLNCHHKTPHEHSSACVTDTWGICHGECLPLAWALEEAKPITMGQQPPSIHERKRP